MDWKAFKIGQKFTVHIRVAANGFDFASRGPFFILDFKRKQTGGKGLSLIGLCSCNGAGSIVIDASKLQPDESGLGFAILGSSGEPSLIMVPAEGTGAGTGLTLGPMPPEPLCPELDGSLDQDE